MVETLFDAVYTHKASMHFDAMSKNVSRRQRKTWHTRDRERTPGVRSRSLHHRLDLMLNWPLWLRSHVTNSMLSRAPKARAKKLEFLSINM